MTKWLFLFFSSLLTILPLDSVASESSLRISVVTNDFVLPSKLQKLTSWAAQQKITLKGFYIEQLNEKTPWFDADLIIIDTPRGGDRARVMAAIKPKLERLSVPWVVIGGGPPLTKNLDHPIAGRLIAYYGAGGETNFRNMFAYFQAWHHKQPLEDIAIPKAVPEAGIYHPDANRLFAYWDEYRDWGKKRWRSNAPVLAIAMSSTFISSSQTRFYDQLVRSVEQAGGIPLVFWFDRQHPTGIQDVIGAANPVMLVNTTHMISAEMRQAEFQQLDIPVVIGLTAREHHLDSWREAAQGISPQMSAAMVSVPESWGMSDPLVLAVLKNGEPEAIPEQLDLLVDRFTAQARLRQQPPAETRLALMFWNSPVGEKNLSASNLNIPQSIAHIMQGLADAGYRIEPLTEHQIVENAQQMLSAYYHPDKLVTLWQQGKAKTLALSDYQHWMDSLPDRVRERLLATWGKPDNNWAVRDIDGQARFVIPAVQHGNLLWLPQPPRADKLGESTHDLQQPPGHLYLAAYLYLRRHYDAHALIHLGTHGTQEWTPGKDRGLWAYDYPNLAVGSMPVFYPYIQDNIGEAIQAKRRGRAVIISHQTPPYSPSGLYDELQQIHDLMHQYMQLEDGGVREQTRHQILEQAIAFNLHTDLGWTEDSVKQQFSSFLPALHDHLHQLAQSTMPVGLHTFGESAKQDLRIATVMQQLGAPFYEALGVDSQELFAAPVEELIQQKPFTFLAPFIRQERSVNSIENKVLRALVNQAINQEKRLAEDDEMEALLHGLQGGFIKPGLGGDPVRQPETTSGTNLYAFDPQKLPSRAAYEAAESLYQSILEDYRQQHNGADPDKLAFTLWSSEAIRTYGLVEGQILHALGVRPEWDSAGRVTGLTIIPDDELKHPRVDVVLQVTSVYRDQFDSLMTKLAAVIERLAAGDVTSNVIARNSQLIQQQLIQKGLAQEQAIHYSRARLFSNPPGDYGSGVTDMAMDSTAWEDDHILADTFIHSQSHIYTTEVWGESVEELGLLQSQLKGTDAVVLSRSSNLHGLLSTDHPFEYLGGLSAVIKQVDGVNPQLYVSDNRQRQSRITAADRFISDELRTRYQNPQWIRGMQQEGYAGTVEILKIVNNVFGWQVMDPNMIRPDQWQALHDSYVMDQRDLGLNEWFEEMNPTAQAQLIERMIEAIRKGYWQADNKTRQQLIDRWQELVSKHGADKGAEKTVEFIEQQLAGFGLNNTPAASLTDQVQTVSGQVLEALQQSDQSDSDWPWQLFILLSVIAAGACHRVYQYQQWNKYDC